MTRRLAPVTRVDDARGMTLAEVIVALFVISVGLLGLMAAMPFGTARIAEANIKTTATFLARQRLEQIRNARWTTSPVAIDTLDGGGSDGSAAVGAWADEAAVASYPRFRRQVRIRDCGVAACGMPPHPTLATLRLVTVTVSFARTMGIGRLDDSTLESVELTTYVARQG